MPPQLRAIDDQLRLRQAHMIKLLAPSPSTLPWPIAFRRSKGSPERAGVRGDALPQRLQPARVLLELGQLILAIDGDHALQQLGRLGDLPFFLSDPGEQVAG